MYRNPNPWETLFRAQLGLIEITDAKDVSCETPKTAKYSEVAISN